VRPYSGESPEKAEKVNKVRNQSDSETGDKIKGTYFLTRVPRTKVM
jgi:hypothetical protein